MTYIDEMMKELCPDGVEWKELGEVAEIGTGKNNTNEQVEDGKYPFYVRSKDIKRINSYLFDEEAIIIPGEGGIGEIFHYVNGKYGLHQRAYRIHVVDDRVDTRFIYYFLQTSFKQFILKKAVSATVSSIRKPMIEKFLIPLPPLEIQQEIVKILDKFTEYVTELTAELTAELTLRQQQYSFYRDKLLSFDEDSSGGANNKVYTVQWKTLGEVARLKNGRDWKSLPSGEVPVYGSGGEMGEFVSDYAYDKPTVLIPRKGSISNLFYLDKPFWNVDTIYYTEIDDSQMMPRYFYHYLTTVDLERLSTNPTRPSLTQAILDKIEIPLPSLAIQSRIVQVLDNFDTVCNDLNIGLPKEIELRQKQYEFFRDKLLTFTAEGVYTDSTVQYSTDKT
ncbi:restriction endonuclease subunit S [Streptococcus ruminantium]|uniref:restriction endonuclease subunit S n=1 Tax=Streptococcus ruminantium TaxID=1917441 RepID=UPI0012DBF151|nr:restriction endonuclease subunit S [Streptococcus ruminantium]